MPFKYEDKHLAQHWTTHSRRIHWRASLKAWIHDEGRHFKHIVKWKALRETQTLCARRSPPRDAQRQ